MKRIGAIFGLGWLGLAAACAPPSSGDESSELADSQSAELRAACGGFAGLACEDADDVCVDDPSDRCDPAEGGADCPGVCRHAKAGKGKCDRANRRYVSTSPDECAAIRFFCEEGAPFFDECGCGCEVDHGPDRCGDSVCGAGEYCCNESCGICAPIGGFCIEQYCGPVCAEGDCGPAILSPNYLCPDGVTVAGPTGNCVPDGNSCGWEMISCP